MSDVQTFAGITSYLVIVTFLIGLSPLADGTTFIFGPEGFDPSADPLKSSTAFKASSGILCVGSLATTITVGIFTGGIGFLGFAAVGLACGSFVYSIVPPSDSADSLDVLLYNVFSFIYVFWQLLTFQLPIGPILNALIVAPAAAPMVYMGIRVLRGGG